MGEKKHMHLFLCVKATWGRSRLEKSVKRDALCACINCLCSVCEDCLSVRPFGPETYQKLLDGFPLPNLLHIFWFKDNVVGGPLTF